MFYYQDQKRGYTLYKTTQNMPYRIKELEFHCHIDERTMCSNVQIKSVTLWCATKRTLMVAKERYVYCTYL